MCAGTARRDCSWLCRSDRVLIAFGGKVRLGMFRVPCDGPYRRRIWAFERPPRRKGPGCQDRRTIVHSPRPSHSRPHDGRYGPAPQPTFHQLAGGVAAGAPATCDRRGIRGGNSRRPEQPFGQPQPGGRRVHGHFPRDLHRRGWPGAPANPRLHRQRPHEVRVIHRTRLRRVGHGRAPDGDDGHPCCRLVPDHFRGER